MAHDKATKDRLRKQYIFERFSLEKAAALCGVSYGTARNWKNKAKQSGDDWDKVRTAHTMAGGDLEDISRTILTNLTIQYHATLEQINQLSDLDAIKKVELLTSLSDSFNKAVAASKKVLPETSKLATALQVIELLSNFIKKNHANQLVDFVAILEDFAPHLEKELS